MSAATSLSERCALLRESTQLALEGFQAVRALLRSTNAEQTELLPSYTSRAKEWRIEIDEIKRRHGL